MRLRALALAVTVWLSFGGAPPLAAKKAPNRPYVQSFEGGEFYARCVPAQMFGTEGTTKIFRVGAKSDVLLDTYAWYSPGRPVLAWTPVDGRVSVLTFTPDHSTTGPNAVLALYHGGRLLKAYTANEVRQMGGQMVKHDEEALPSLVAQRVETDQIPGTNEQVFSIFDRAGHRLRFDMRTGDRFLN